MIIGYQGEPLRYHIEGTLSHAKDKINVQFMHQGDAWDLKSLTIPLLDEIKELIRDILMAQYHIRPDKIIWLNGNGQCTMKGASKFIYTYEGVHINKS